MLLDLVEIPDLLGLREFQVLQDKMEPQEREAELDSKEQEERGDQLDLVYVLSITNSQFY